MRHLQLFAAATILSSRKNAPRCHRRKGSGVGLNLAIHSVHRHYLRIRLLEVGAFVLVALLSKQDSANKSYLKQQDGQIDGLLCTPFC